VKLVSTTDICEEIVVAAKGRAMYDKLLVDSIQKARDHHVSWARIGASLGVTRQAVTERYKHLMRADDE
jgi:hypothetical protein